jgi:hypothetical protein
MIETILHATLYSTIATIVIGLFMYLYFLWIKRKIKNLFRKNK